VSLSLSVSTLAFKLQPTLILQTFTFVNQFLNQQLLITWTFLLNIFYPTTS